MPAIGTCFDAPILALSQQRKRFLPFGAGRSLLPVTGVVLLGDDLFRLECCNHISAEREACMSRRIIRGNDVEIATGAFDGRAHPSVLLVMRAPMPWWPERFCSRIPDKTAMAELVRSY